MSNNLSISGGQLQKPTRFAPIYTGRWSSGIWTNRSPLRDANTTRLTEKFYGPSGDALIAGLNVEITNRLTLARRPGNSLYDSNTFNNVDRFYSFKVFSSTNEIINLMVDQSNALYSDYNGTSSLVFTKSSGAGSSYMQSIGNTLYFANGLDNKKWLQTLTQWQPNTQYGTDTTPFGTTFVLDSNSNILQLYGTVVFINNITVGSPTSTSQPSVTITSPTDISPFLSVGDTITYTEALPGTISAFIGYSSKVVSITGPTMTVTYPINWLIAPVSQAVGTYVTAIYGGKPTSDGILPTGPSPTLVTKATQVSAEVPNTVIDGSVVWLNKGSTVETWGISNTDTVPFYLQPVDVGALGGVPARPQYQSGHTYAANSYVRDPNGNIQFTAAGGTGAGAGIVPTFSTILGQNTIDGTITWTTFYLNSVSTFNGGWKYCVAIVNTLDNTVSNVSPISYATGNFIGVGGVQLFGNGNSIAPGPGLQTKIISPNTTSVDPQADAVAIFRTTDGGSVPFLIPGVSTTYTVSLKDFLASGYVDNTPDTGLNNLISAPLSNENTIPQKGAANITLHLGRLFYSVGNVVYWTSGSNDPVGNGLNGYEPLTNFASTSSLVTRLVSTPIGLFVFTISDVYIIQGNGTTNSPFLGAVLILPGVGLLHYDALGQNGATIGLYTTDKQFVTIDPSDALSHVGTPIADQLRLNTGTPGQSWNPSTAYVTYHSEGDDQAWYIADGQNGWYRLMVTPSPETGLTWSPFASIQGGVKAVQSIEVSPGIRHLLLGPVTSGNILKRDLSVFSDNGAAYPANATIGSCVLTEPGQVAAVSHITTECVNTGSPLSLGILVNEALPYYTGPIDILKNYTNDPPELPVSTSLLAQRFYLSDLQDEVAVMRHCQLQILWSELDTVQNELLTMTVFGAFYQEL